MSFPPQTTAANLKSADLETDRGGVLSVTGDPPLDELPSLLDSPPPLPGEPELD